MGGVGGAVTVEEDFRLFVAARQRALLRSAGLLTGDAGLAEDLVQAALVKSWPHWSRLMARGDAEAYVRRVLVTTHIGWRRRRWRGEVPTGALPEPASNRDTTDVDVQVAVRRALLALPPRQRAAVILRYFDDLTEQQTAAALGCSVGTVKSQTSRGLDKLRRQPGLSDLLTEGATA